MFLLHIICEHLHDLYTLNSLSGWKGLKKFIPRNSFNSSLYILFSMVKTQQFCSCAQAINSRENKCLWKTVCRSIQITRRVTSSIYIFVFKDNKMFLENIFGLRSHGIVLVPYHPLLCSRLCCKEVGDRLPQVINY